MFSPIVYWICPCHSKWMFILLWPGKGHTYTERTHKILLLTVSWLQTQVQLNVQMCNLLFWYSDGGVNLFWPFAFSHWTHWSFFLLSPFPICLHFTLYFHPHPSIFFALSSSSIRSFQSHINRLFSLPSVESLDHKVQYKKDIGCNCVQLEAAKEHWEWEKRIRRERGCRDGGEWKRELDKIKVAGQTTTREARHQRRSGQSVNGCQLLLQRMNWTIKWQKTAERRGREREEEEEEKDFSIAQLQQQNAHSFIITAIHMVRVREWANDSANEGKICECIHM